MRFKYKGCSTVESSIWIAIVSRAIVQCMIMPESHISTRPYSLNLYHMTDTVLKNQCVEQCLIDRKKCLTTDYSKTNVKVDKT